MTTASHRLSVAAPLAVVATLALALTACAPTESPRTTPTNSSAPAPDDDKAMADALAERDAFLEEQQLPLDGSPLVAVTEAQKQLVAQARERAEAQGGTWTEREEWILLALGSDTCESGILNQHRIDAEFMMAMLSGSPLVQQLVPADATQSELGARLQGIAKTAVFAAGYMCPDDKAAWDAALQEAFPE